MNNQVLDTQLNLAFDATLEELEKSLDLDVGYDSQTGQWEAIVRYAGAGKGAEDRSQSEMQGLSVTWLSGGYGIIRGTKAAIDAFSEFKKSHLDFIFEIYGKGELEQELKNYVSSLGLNDSVVFKGFCTDVHERIIDASMFLISSDYEGLSNSMIESMALGIPTIATDCPIGGARMVINSGINGYLVPVNNKEKIVEAMSRIADDSKLAEQLSNNAYKIREQLSVDRICLEWRNVIDEML